LHARKTADIAQSGTKLSRASVEARWRRSRGAARDSRDQIRRRKRMQTGHEYSAGRRS
jgi:hypothetical protein